MNCASRNGSPQQIPLRQLPFANKAKPHYRYRAFRAQSSWHVERKIPYQFFTPLFCSLEEPLLSCLQYDLSHQRQGCSPVIFQSQESLNHTCEIHHWVTQNQLIDQVCLFTSSVNTKMFMLQLSYCIYSPVLNLTPCIACGTTDYIAPQSFSC